MAEKIGFEDPEDDSLCFSLNECVDGVTISRGLAPDKEVLGIMESWFGKPEAKFIFVCKLYADSIINSKDPKIIHMLFIQNVYNVITGTYPTSEKEAINLAALQFQVKFGLHKPESHKPGFLTNSILEYVPGPHLQSNSKTIQAWEEAIFHKHAYSLTTNPREAYLQVLNKRDYFGAVLFAVKQRYNPVWPRKIFMGISRRGILLLRIPLTFVDDNGMETLASYPLADIYRWAYKPGVNFYFEIKRADLEINPVYSYETPEGKHMSDLLTDYAMALLREMGLNPDGSKRISPKEKKQMAAAAAAAAESGASAEAAKTEEAADVVPSKEAMAASEAAYASVGGEIGSLASAAVRSGEAEVQEGEQAPAANLDDTVVAASGDAPASEDDLPPNWIKVFDEGSQDYYYFNQVSGESVWERSEVK
jgi:FERM central domain/WW domain